MLEVFEFIYSDDSKIFSDVYVAQLNDISSRLCFN